MEESGLQHWLQWRLLQPVETNLAEHDLQRWGQWWHERDGQAFWQTCEWLWHTLGPRAIGFPVQAIEGGLVEDEVQRWQDGNKEALGSMCVWLWQRCVPSATRFLLAFIDDSWSEDQRQQKADDLAQGAFWYALEEMDLKVSGGKLLMESTDKIRKVKEQEEEKQPDGTVVSTTTVTEKKVFKGKVSERELSERKPFAWRGVEPFAALFGRILAFRCIDALRREEHSFTEPHKQVFTYQHVRLESARHDDDEQQGGAYEEETPGTSPNPGDLVLDRSAVCVLIEDLAQVAEQLHHEKAEALAEIVEALILFVKRQVANSNPATAAVSDEQLREQTIEELLDLVEVEEIAFDEAKLWSFVQQHLKLGRDTLYKRKERLFARLPTLPQVPATLRAAFGALWLTEMQNRVEDCHAAAQRLEKSNNEPLAQLLRLVEDYLRWIFAQGSRVHRSHSLEWVQNASPKDLFKVNNPALLTPTYPTAQDFRQFVTAHCSTKASLLTALPRLQAAIDGLGKPRPIRLVNLIKALLQETDSDDEDNSGAGKEADHGKATI